jgi:hypothetical protein
MIRIPTKCIVLPCAIFEYLTNLEHNQSHGVLGGSMRRLSFLAAITLVAASTAAANEQSDCLTNGDVDLRIRSCSELIQREPNNATAYNSRAAAYVTKGDYNSAVADVVKAGELAPKKKPQAIAARPVTQPKTALAPPKKSAPAMTESTLPAWAQALFGKSAAQE